MAVLLILALAGPPTAGADTPAADANATADTVTIQNMLEFGPLEDRDELKKQSRARFMARNPTGRAPAAKETAPAVTARLDVPELYDSSGDLTVTAEVVPSSETETVRLMVRRPGEVTYSPVSMRLTAPGRFAVTLGPEYTKRDYLKLYLEAVLLGGGEPVLHGNPQEPIVATARAAGTAGGVSFWILAAPLTAIVAWQIARRRGRGIPLPPFVSSRPARPQGPHAETPHPAAQPAEGARVEMNPYQVLRIQRTATTKEIDDAHCLMRKLNFYGTVRDSLALIDLAHDLLMDPVSRREVDEALRHGESPAGQTPHRRIAATMKEAGP